MCRGKVKEAVHYQSKLLYNNFEILEPQPHRTYADKKKENAQKGQLIFIEVISIAKPERMKSMHHSSFNCQARANSIEIDSVRLDSVIQNSICSLNEKN